MRVFELARALNIRSMEVMTILNELGILVTSHASVVDTVTVLKVCDQMGYIRPQTILYVDVYNLFWVARRYYGWPPDFAKLLEVMTDSPLPWAAKAFMPNNGRADGFEQALRRMGYQVFTKKGHSVAPGRMKANLDVEITVEAMKDLQECRPKTVFIASGDGDFGYLVKALRRAGCRVTVAAFPEGLSQELKEAADAVVELGAEFLLSAQGKRTSLDTKTPNLEATHGTRKAVPV